MLARDLLHGPAGRLNGPSRRNGPTSIRGLQPSPAVIRICPDSDATCAGTTGCSESNVALMAFRLVCARGLVPPGRGRGRIPWSP
jgi:hypothetical protein